LDVFSASKGVLIPGLTIPPMWPILWRA
jgi:hypothetical protein